MNPAGAVSRLCSIASLVLPPGAQHDERILALTLELNAQFRVTVPFKTTKIYFQIFFKYILYIDVIYKGDILGKRKSNLSFENIFISSYTFYNVK